MHSNGFSLVRKVVADNNLNLNEKIEESGDLTLGEMLLTPTRIYCRQVHEVLKEVDVHGIAHITGGGFDENIPRILKDGQGVEVKEGSWEILPVFRFLEKYGNIPHREMFNIFNMGIGMVLAVDEKDADKVIEILSRNGEKASVIGKIVEGSGVTVR